MEECRNLYRACHKHPDGVKIRWMQSKSVLPKARDELNLEDPGRSDENPDFELFSRCRSQTQYDHYSIAFNLDEYEVIINDEFFLDAPPAVQEPD